MQAVRSNAYLSDEDWAAKVTQGDLDAYAMLYTRYFPRMYDFALRVTGNQGEAEEVVGAAFGRALESLLKGQAPRNFRAWLFTIAHRLCIDAYRRSSREVSADDEGDEEGSIPYSAVAPVSLSDRAPEDEVHRRELQELVWSAATALSPEEYSLLDLQVRQGLDRDELAEYLGISKAALYTRLSRLKDSFEQAVISLLLMRQGRRRCKDLDALIIELKAATFTRLVRQAIWGHLQKCRVCQDSRLRFASPMEIFAGIPLLAAPPGLKEAIWQRLEIQFDANIPQRSAQRNVLERTIDGWSKRLRLIRGKDLAAASGLMSVVVVAAIVWFILLTGRDPVDVRSPSHVIGVPTPNNIVIIEWSVQPGAVAYAFLWSLRPTDLPDTSNNLLPGTATYTASPPLLEGSWYFHLRTKGRNGRWTSTVHLGPFKIVNPFARGPSPGPLGTPTNTSTPFLPSTDAPVQVVSTTARPTLPPTDTPAATFTPTKMPTLLPTYTWAPSNTPVSIPTSTKTPVPSDTPFETAVQTTTSTPVSTHPREGVVELDGQSGVE